MTTSYRKRKVRIKGHELTDGSCEFISLVPRGANQAPFKKVASAAEESPVIQLEKLGRGLVFKSRGIKPVIGAVLVDKAAKNLERAKALVAAAGFKVEKADESHDEFLIYPQAEQPEGSEMRVIKYDGTDHAVLVYVSKGFQPSYEGLSFDENISQQGVYPSLGMGVDALMTTLSNTLYRSENRDTALSGAEKALKAFSDHVLSVLREIPSDAWKFDRTFKADFAELERKADWIISLTQKTEEPPVEKTEVEKIETPPVETPPATPEVKAEAAPTIDMDALTALVKKAVQDGVAGIETKVTELGSRIEAVESRTVQVTKDAARVTQVLKGLTAAPASGSDGSDLEDASEEVSEPAFLDTAYVRPAN